MSPRIAKSVLAFFVSLAIARGADAPATSAPNYDLRHVTIWIDGTRMEKDYAFVETYLGMEKPYDVRTAFTTRMLDTSVRMDATKMRR